jgi:hypothetical protein
MSLEILNQKFDRLLSVVTEIAQVVQQRVQTEDARVEGYAKQMADLSQVLTELREQQAINSFTPEQQVKMIATQIQSVFSNPVMLDSVTAAILTAGLNALRQKAATSKDRQPQLVVRTAYIKGAFRAKLSGLGDLTVEEQLADATDKDSGWVVSQTIMGNKGAIESFQELLASSGCDADVWYYLIDDVTLQTLQEQINSRAYTEHAGREAAIRKADDAPADVADPAPTALHAFDEPAAPAAEAAPAPAAIPSALGGILNELAALKG